jgi:hypothetical protein
MITKTHHDRRRLDRVVGAEKINPRYWPPGSPPLLIRQTGVNEAVSTHDSDSSGAAARYSGVLSARSSCGCAQAEGAI